MVVVITAFVRIIKYIEHEIYVFHDLVNKRNLKNIRYYASICYFTFSFCPHNFMFFGRIVAENNVFVRYEGKY